MNSGHANDSRQPTQALVWAARTSSVVVTGDGVGGRPAGCTVTELEPSAPMSAEHFHPVGASTSITPSSSEYRASFEAEPFGRTTLTLVGRLTGVSLESPTVVLQTFSGSCTETRSFEEISI